MVKLFINTPTPRAELIPPSWMVWRETELKILIGIRKSQELHGRPLSL